MPDCLFCKIATGEIPSAKVYEDNDLLAFLDINPLARGHTLVIPKRHATKLEDVDAAALAAMMPVVQRLSRAACEAADSPDATVAINNGPAAGQEVPHMHLHIVPRRTGDQAGSLHSLFRTGAGVPKEEIKGMADTIRMRLREQE